jgi:NAD(P)-dependent dehydrogenase (short-subunit alcohol dehydrogenase family)
MSAAERGPELRGPTVVVIGGSAGIGLETARRARAEGADVVLTGRNADPLHEAAREIDARSTSAFDAHDTAALNSFFTELPTPIDHPLVTAGSPPYGRLVEADSATLSRELSAHVLLTLNVARCAADKLRPGGCGRRSRSGASSTRATSPRSPFTS